METVDSRCTQRTCCRKTELAAQTTNDSSRGIYRSDQTVRRSLNEKLASVVLDFEARNQKKSTSEYGQVKAEAEEIFLKKELDEDWSRESTENESLYPDFLQEEHEKGVDDPIQMKKRLEISEMENSRLKNYLQMKERLIQELQKGNHDVEAEFNFVMARLDSTEKENAFLRYEFRVLEKEFEIRTEEMEYNRRSAELAAKQHLQSVNRIVELEAEIRKLRLLVRQNSGFRDGFGRNQEQNKNLKGTDLMPSSVFPEFKDEKFKNLTGQGDSWVSEMSLYMKDFVEMEKLAIVSSELDSRKEECDESFDWIQVVLEAFSRERRVSKRTDQELLEDLSIALGCMENREEKEEMKKMAGKIETLETELRILKESRDVIEDQMETQKTVNEDLETQLTVARSRLNEALQKFSSLEVELDYRNSCCEELEGTCLDLELQLQSVVKKEPTNSLMNQEETNLQNRFWEISTASKKLAECQETIQNLRKQLKTLTSDSLHLHNLPTETDKKKQLTRRSSLRDQMKAEDGDKEEEAVCISPEKPSSADDVCNAIVVYTPRVYSSSRSKNRDETGSVVEMAMVPRSENHGFGYLKKLLLWRKRGSKKKKQCLALVKV